MAKTLIGNIKGPKGDRGADGVRGVQGPAGATGATGPQGLDGDSAYQIAVNNGFEGSEEDWLASLEGGTFVGTITGTIATATDSTDAPIISLKSNGYTEQDGTPTPDAPIEIEGLDKVSVKTCGKNLLEITANNITAYGITLTVNEDKSITLNGTATQDFITKIGEFNNSDDSYFMSGCPSGGSTSSYYLVASCRDENNTWKADNIDVGSGKALANGYAKRLIQIGIKSGKTVSNLTFYPMIRKAEIADATYQPYTETTAAIPTDAPLYEGDYIEYRADGTGVLHRKMAKVVFDGSSDEYWDYDISNSIIVFFARLSNECAEMYTGKECCTHYQTAKVYWTYASDKTCGFIKDFKNNFCILDSSYSNLASFKTWLQSNPVTVVYELATPQEIELTAEQLAQFKQLRTFEPITNIFSDSETTIQYYKNSDSGECVAGLQERVDGKANISHGNHIPDTCKLIADWNEAVTTGWYMGSNAQNKPPSPILWWIGTVTCHNTNYLVQEVWGLINSALTENMTKYMRVKMNGEWGNWVDISPNSYAKKSDKYIIIMDSYGNPVIPNGGGTITPFINRLPALMGWSSDDYKASYQDGAGFGNGLFLSQLKTLRNSMTSEQAKEYTNIVVLGGYNDWQQTFISLKTAMQTFCDYAKTNFPNAIIQIGYISGSRRAGDRYNLKIVPLNTYRCASLVGAVYLRNLEYVLHDNCYFLTGDNQYQHPLDIGHELLAPFIAEALKTGGCSVARQHTKYKVTFASGITETVALNITSSQVNDQLTIANEIAFMTFNSNKTINDAEYFNIGTLPRECHIIGSYQSYEGNYFTTVAYTDSSDNSGVCPASIHFNGRTGDTGNVTVQLCLYTGGKTLTLKSICIYANSGLISANEC